jgi:inosose dehydratase
MLKIGCQTYTWEMLGADWAGDADELLDAIGAAGYAGIEITDNMIGKYKGKPRDFAEALRARGLAFIAYACGSNSGFTEPSALAGDLAMVGDALNFLVSFPGTVLSLGSATIMSPGLKAKKFEAAAKFYNDAGTLGRRLGVPVAFHPSSHHNTLLGTREEYDEIMRMTDPERIGWVPDTGHMLRLGHDMLDTVRTYLDRMRYLHLKDVDAQGQWQMLGKGSCNTEAVVKLVSTAPHFTGWVVLEEESDDAARDPAKAVKINREAIGSMSIMT